MSGPALASARFSPREAQPLENSIANAKDILHGLFDPPKSSDLPPLAKAQMELQAEIKRIAAEKFSDEAGRLLLEALCDAILRRPFMLPPMSCTAEQAMRYADQREGQAQALYLLLSMIAEGRGEDPQPREGS